MAFDEAIRTFATERLRKKKVIREDAFASHRQISEILFDMALRGKRVFPATHIAKGGHPSSRSRNIWMRLRETPRHTYIGTATLLESRNYTIDVAADATTQDVAAFISVIVEDKSVAEWMIGRDESLESALSTYIDHPKRFMEGVAEPDERTPTSVDKQIYWLKGPSAEQDDDFVILQPVFASCVVQFVYHAVRTVNSKANGEARTAWRKGEASDLSFSLMPGLAMRQIGGSKPHNVSYLNARRFGENYLLPSIPPAWNAIARPVTLSHQESGVSVFLRLSRAVTDMLDALSEENSIAQGRARNVENDLIGRFISFSEDVRGSHPSEWFNSDDCTLIETEKKWFRYPPGRSGEMSDWCATVLMVSEIFASSLSALSACRGEGGVGFNPSEFASRAARYLMLSTVGPAGLEECEL
ncbi:CRISPR-associated Csy1 family protein [Acetobacter malorum DSM 14337]|uniref:CRISPR-associated Csy1 family protein n=1 Tax=Acetobacter malorum DSM 14337 TaxID=1307910 RepID=A0ABQ0PYT3_9PROT|nr:type I-F CRISPR-associated protein Csy1 [Acetobacter malorum]GBQ84977.1 CRISPR-associated Csy1 family protein [Acetobacter malorum DSM 14337]